MSNKLNNHSTSCNIDLGQVFTRKVIAEYMVNLFTLPNNSRVLDPCFGKGIFLDTLLCKNKYSISGCEIDSNLYMKYGYNHKNLKLVNGDFLSIPENETYDGIIMNPPYIRHEKIDELSPYGITKSSIRKNPLFHNLSRSANMYMYFIVKSICILRDLGELVVIFPETWLNSKGGINFKKYLESTCSIEKHIHVRGQTFETDALVDVIILKLVKNSKKENANPTFIQVNGEDIVDVGNNQSIPNVEFKSNFGKYGLVRRGFTTGHNKMFINPDELYNTGNDIYLKDIISSPKSIAGYSTAFARLDKLLVIPPDTQYNDILKNYIQKCQSEILANQNPKTLFTLISKNENWFSRTVFNCKGIWFSYIVRQDMKFIYNDNCEYIARDNFYIIYPKINPLLLFALLNNYYTYYQLELYGKKYGNGILKIQKYDIEQLQLPDIEIISADDQTQLCSYSTELIQNGKSDNIINAITKILSKYEQTEYLSIYEKYTSVKQKRLAGEYNANKSC